MQRQDQAVEDIPLRLVNCRRLLQVVAVDWSLAGAEEELRAAAQHPLLYCTRLRASVQQWIPSRTVGLLQQRPHFLNHWHRTMMVAVAVPTLAWQTEP